MVDLGFSRSLQQHRIPTPEELLHALVGVGELLDPVAQTLLHRFQLFRRPVVRVVGGRSSGAGAVVVAATMPDRDGFLGSKQDGTAFRTSTGGALDELADQGLAVVAYLDGYRGNWNDARAASTFPARTEGVDDVAFARAVVDAVVESHDVDRSAVVGTGYSNGGQMVFRLLHDAADVLAGAVVVAATMPDRDGFLGAYSETAERAVPLTLVAGTADRIVPFAGGRMAWWARRLFKVDGVALSAERTADHFARRNGITSAPVTTDVPAVVGARPGTTMHERRYRAPGRPPVTLYTVVGGGHTVPGATAAPAVLGRTGSARGIATIVREVLDAVGAA